MREREREREQLLKQIINNKYDRTFNDEKFRKIKDKIYLGLNMNENLKISITNS